MTRILLLIIWLFTLLFSYGQKPEYHSFKVGEKASYDIYYNWQFVWLQAAQVRFMVKEAIYENKAVYHFDSQGGTLDSYNWIYHVNDRYQSYANPITLNTYWSIRDVKEGKTELYNQQHFNYNDSTINVHLQSLKKGISFDTLPFKKQPFDVLTAVYKCRNLDFSHFNTGDTIPIPVVIDNEIFNLYIRYLGKEKLKHKNDKIYATIKFSVLLVEGTIFSGGEDMVVWVSDDLNRIPIHVEANIMVGSIKAYLKDVSGQKHPSIKY